MVNLSWVNGAAAQTSITLQRATNAAFTGTVVSTTLAANAVTYADTAVALNTTYYYRISASNVLGTSTPSAAVTAVVPALPTTPTGLAQGTITTTYSGPAVALTWVNGAVPQTSVVVQRASNVGFTTGLTAFTVVGTATNYTDTAVATNTTYYYRISSVNAVGISANSASVRVNVGAAVTAPSRLASTPGTGTLALTWTAATGQSGYTIQYATDAAFTQNVVTTAYPNPALTAQTLTGLARRTQYYVRIESTSVMGTSAWVTFPTGSTRTN